MEVKIRTTNDGSQKLVDCGVNVRDETNNLGQESRDVLELRLNEGEGNVDDERDDLGDKAVDLGGDVGKSGVDRGSDSVSNNVVENGVDAGELGLDEGLDAADSTVDGGDSGVRADLSNGSGNGGADGDGGESELEELHFGGLKLSIKE